MFTLYWIAFHVGWCSTVWTVSNGAHRTGTSRSYTSNIVPEPFRVRVWWTNSIPYSWIFASALVDSSLLSYLFTLAKVRIPALHRTIVWHKSYPICRRSTFEIDRGQLCAEIPVGVCKRKPYPVWFSYRRKRYPVLCEHSRQLLPTARTELGQWQGGKRGTGSRSVLPARFAPSSHLPLCCPFSLSTLTFHVGQDVELGRVVVGSFAEFSTDPNFLVLLFKDGATALSGHLPITSVRLLRVL